MKFQFIFIILLSINCYAAPTCITLEVIIRGPKENVIVIKNRILDRVYDVIIPKQGIIIKTITYQGKTMLECPPGERILKVVMHYRRLSLYSSCVVICQNLKINPVPRPPFPSTSNDLAAVLLLFRYLAIRIGTDKSVKNIRQRLFNLTIPKKSEDIILRIFTGPKPARFDPSKVQTTPTDPEISDTYEDIIEDDGDEGTSSSHDPGKGTSGSEVTGETESGTTVTGEGLSGADDTKSSDGSISGKRKAPESEEGEKSLKKSKKTKHIGEEESSEEPTPSQTTKGVTHSGLVDYPFDDDEEEEEEELQYIGTYPHFTTKDMSSIEDSDDD